MLAGPCDAQQLLHCRLVFPTGGAKSFTGPGCYSGIVKRRDQVWDCGFRLGTNMRKGNNGVAPDIRRPYFELAPDCGNGGSGLRPYSLDCPKRVLLAERACMPRTI